VIEIVPGTGGLTLPLAERAGKLIAVELDERMIEGLRIKTFGMDNVEIIHNDILKVDLKELINRELDENGLSDVRIVGNLPYYITTPIIMKLLSADTGASSITVMMQKEVGDRFAAKPKDSAYSALSVEAQFLYDVKKLFTVPGRSFNPSPNVDSVIVQFTRKETDLRKEEIRAFYEMVRACFKQRRKTLYNNLKEYLQDKEKAEEALNACGIPLSLRAQEADTGMLYRVFEEIRK
jgi:16S rRNA (adenine1518-N6/adenine1519-N6)-dimethyltransferase